MTGMNNAGMRRYVKFFMVVWVVMVFNGRQTYKKNVTCITIVDKYFTEQHIVLTVKYFIVKIVFNNYQRIK
jgi:hypothetical protein